MFRRFLKSLLILLIAAAAFGTFKILVAGDIPELKDGDLIFQTSMHPQSAGIVAASLSTLSHVGIIKQTPEGIMVVDTGKAVRTIPLDKWIASGMAGRFEIYRHKTLKDDLRKLVAQSAEHYLGKPYDIYFLMGDNQIYCSELVWLAYLNIDVMVGRIEKVSDLAINNRFSQKLIEERWKSYPPCAEIKDYEICKKIIMDQKLVTPVSIAEDANFERIYSNYPY